MASASETIADSPVEPERSPGRVAAVAAAVIALCFCVHATNGFFIERRYLGFHSYSDYSSLSKLRAALGSAPWLASGTAHLVTGVAIVVLGANLAALMRPTNPRLSGYLRYATAAACVGFTTLGVADVQGSQTVALLARHNPEFGNTAYMAISVVVPIVDGLAIVAFGWMMIITARFAQSSSSGLPRWYAVLSYVAGATGLLMGLVYVPAYLVFFLAWAASTAALLWAPRSSGPLAANR